MEAMKLIKTFYASIANAINRLVAALLNRINRAT